VHRLAITVAFLLSGCASLPPITPFQEQSASPIERAYQLRNENRKAEAVALLEQAAMADPNNVPLIRAFGRALIDDGRDISQGIRVLENALDPAAPDVSSRNAMAAGYAEIGNLLRAKELFAQALKLDPTNAMVLVNNAKVY